MSKARIATAFALTLSVFGCSNATTRHGGSTGGNGPTTGQSPDGGTAGGGGSGGGGFAGGGSGGTAGGSTNNCVPGGPNDDEDMDGYTPAQGDCNDCDPGINPGAVEVPGDGVDNDCNGMVDEPQPACDTGATGKNDAASIAQSIELCDSRFLKDAKIVPATASSSKSDPSPDEARNVLTSFGMFTPHVGANMTMLSTGIAYGVNGVSYVPPQEGTGFNTTAKNPLPSIVGPANCPSTVQNNVNDYTEVALTIKAPTNVKSFSFDFQFFSAEYPEFVCSAYNDEFFAIISSSKTYTTAQNISFDSANNPVTINSGFFTTCTNGMEKGTQNCKTPVTALNGTGYETIETDEGGGGIFGGTVMEPAGGSTGWLTTTAPISPGEDITLRFVIFDESDAIYDSAVLLDNFKWGTTMITGPVTGPITYRTKKVHHKTPAHESLMCGA